MPTDKEIERTDLECALEIVNYPAEGAPYGIERHAAILRDAYLSMKAELDKYKAIVEADTRALDAADSLMNDSTGVYGLHLNGDLAPWRDLRTGGYMEEWLLDFDKALAIR